jgi:hypothetical protein
MALVALLAQLLGLSLISEVAPFVGLIFGVLSWKTPPGKLGFAINLGFILLAWGLIWAIRHNGLFGPNSRPGDF